MRACLYVEGRLCWHMNVLNSSSLTHRRVTEEMEVHASVNQPAKHGPQSYQMRNGTVGITITMYATNNGTNKNTSHGSCWPLMEETRFPFEYCFFLLVILYTGCCDAWWSQAAAVLWHLDLVPAFVLSGSVVFALRCLKPPLSGLGFTYVASVITAVV